MNDLVRYETRAIDVDITSDQKTGVLTFQSDDGVPVTIVLRVAALEYLQEKIAAALSANTPPIRRQ